MNTLGQSGELRLLGRAKMLLLVDYDEAEIVEFHVLRGESLRSDHDFHLAASQPFLRLPHLRAGRGARQVSHFDIEWGETPAERCDVLPCQDGRRHRNRYLLSRQ